MSRLKSRRTCEAHIQFIIFKLIFALLPNIEDIRQIELVKFPSGTKLWKLDDVLISGMRNKRILKQLAGRARLLVRALICLIAVMITIDKQKTRGSAKEETVTADKALQKPLG